MRTFPQELVDRIIDELADLNDYQACYIAPYSLISRAWVTHTQRYCFEQIHFDGSEELEKWRRKIEPDPAGVSRHTRRLVLTDIVTLETFETHIRAFTQVEEAEITECDFILSPSVVEYFTPMGSSLVQLLIGEGEITSSIITSLLAALTKLKKFTAMEVKVIDDADGAKLTSRVPFFEGGNSGAFYSHADQIGSPDWIPPSARFSELQIDTIYFLHKGGLVNQWLSSSCTNLRSLAIHEDLTEAFLPDPFTPLDLSPCQSLAELYISVGLHEPGVIAETILPSIVSSQLSYVQLHSEGDPEDEDHIEIGYQAWTTAEDHLCRLAKLFSVGNPGKKMEVVIAGGDWFEPRIGGFLERVGCKEFLPKLKEEVVVTLRDIPGED